MRRSSTVVFRTDGSPDVGLGHVTRCLALAQAFASRGHRAVFAGSAPAFLRDNAPVDDWFDVPQCAAAWDDERFSYAVGAADILVTDSYAIDADWQRQSPVPVLAITDPPLREQHCKLLLLPAVMRNGHDARVLQGPQHCLIRKEIADARSSVRSGTAVLISCGGGNDAGLAMRVAEAIRGDNVLRGLPLTFVLGVGVSRAEIANAVEQCPRATILETVSDMATLMNDHAIAVGTPSGSALERACLGLAQVLIPIAENQHELGVELAARKAAITLDGGADGAAIAAAVRDIVEDAAKRESLAAAGYALIDGRGAERVVEAVEQEVFRA